MAVEQYLVNATESIANDNDPPGGGFWGLAEVAHMSSLRVLLGLPPAAGTRRELVGLAQETLKVLAEHKEREAKQALHSHKTSKSKPEDEDS